MHKEFSGVDRGWLLFNQPPQSPITNVHDACIFPMMSKAVSTEQSITFSSRLLKGEQLNQTVRKVWNDERNTVAMSRAFAGHHQIVCAILQNNGDNSYLSRKGGLSFGIRKNFVCDEEGEGVVPITMAPQHKNETAQGEIRKMKYQVPKLSDLPVTPTLTDDMKAMLMEYMDIEMMSNELIEAWAEDIAGADIV